ncbi:MAG: glycosyltransferase family 4 protein [Pontiellaceae bacterium]|nr:glycosyltransferase family 4 protein [Pontiellaceae bacterium]MBN2783915.1 glycosyltransferase family 4 protein [Pontiellaceae bacterium]
MSVCEAPARVLVCQHGSRHRYAIPRMMEEAGLLAGLYTDSSVYSPLGKAAAGLAKIGIKGAGLNALQARIPEGVPREKVFSSDRTLASVWRRSDYGDLSAAFIRRGLSGANVVYNMFGEDLGFVEWAKERGCGVLVDVFVHPGTTAIVAEEHRQFIGVDEEAERMVSILHEYHQKTFSLADILLCPSNWVAEGIRELFPDHAHKIRVVPYGSSLIAHGQEQNAPVPGRILFAGREPLRKGVHYLAEATHLLRADGVSIDSRVAGVEKSWVSWIQYADELSILGQLPRVQMQAEFASADVFVLPSLSEGQASVILEAMACGCPVIATRESGVDFLPGCGVTVPSKDPKALAAAIADIIKDRSRRETLAAGSLRQAAEYSVDSWKSRLVRVVEEAASFSKGVLS